MDMGGGLTLDRPLNNGAIFGCFLLACRNDSNNKQNVLKRIKVHAHETCTRPRVCDARLRSRCCDCVLLLDHSGHSAAINRNQGPAGLGWLH